MSVNKNIANDNYEQERALNGPGCSMQSALWYFNRLAAMSPAEVMQRLLQQGRASAERSGFLTAAEPPRAEFTKASARFVRVPVEHVDPEPWCAAADRILAGRLSVFRRQINVIDWNWNQDAKTGILAPLTPGKSLDYRDERLVGDIRYLWEPNRHLHLVTLAQAWSLTKSDRYAFAIREQLTSWFDACPYLRGPNWSSALELAIRLINWSLVWQLIGGLESPLLDGAGKTFRDRWLRSIYQHMHFVRTMPSKHSSANNHLIGECAGVFIAAQTWPYWPETRLWAAGAQRTLLREAHAQNTDEGVNREQTVWYQHFVLDFLILAGLADRAGQKAFPASYWQLVHRMIRFLAAIMDSAGRVPMIGDADDGYVTRLSVRDDFDPFRTQLATGARLFDDDALRAKAASVAATASSPADDAVDWLLEPGSKTTIPDVATGDPLPRQFPDGGYYVLGAAFDSARETRAVVDCGPLGYLSIAAHGHADALSLCLSVRGREFLIDPGTFAYHTEARWRNYFRSTRAHNTVTVDEQDQSVIAGNFMWRQHANARCERFESGAEFDLFRGSHDGYRRLEDPVIHRREITYRKPLDEFLIEDVVQCKGAHTVDRWWHFAEDCTVEPVRDGVAVRNGDVSILLRSNDEDIEWRIFRRAESPMAGWMSRHFDEKTETTSVRCRTRISTGRSLSTVIACSPDTDRRASRDPRSS